MHLGTFNISDLLLPLWRGLFDHDRLDPPSNWPWAVLHGETWEEHGTAVAAATPYLPGSFDRPPRNIAEKINSGYKAWEWLLYLYGLAPALLFGILPQPYYSHFCKLVRAMRIIQQYHIKSSELILADHLLRSFAFEFETLYYQRREDRIHFCRQSVHALLHLASEVTRIGPPICSSQWTMERTIGNLGEEIRQPSNPYSNLSQRGLLRCQTNALIAMFPSLRPSQCNFPRGALDLGGGYVLLRAQDRYSRLMTEAEATAFKIYISHYHSLAQFGNDWPPKVVRWARLRLPDGQIARSRWKEALKPLNKIRTSRHVKFIWNDSISLGEVLYYYQCRIKGTLSTLAVISVFSSPLPALVTQSHGTFISCKYFGDRNLIVVNVDCIKAVVAMIPHSPPADLVEGNTMGGEEKYYYLVERPGLDITYLGGHCEESN